MRPYRFLYSVLMLALFVVPVPVRAQTATTGAIAGVVKDTTGAVLPGVTVEAASPALIEKVRSVVTDDRGEYKIVDLRPGTYSVTFTLTGFSTAKRDGLELSAGFTATVNGDLKVGALTETITVTGASPVVDVQNSRTQQVLESEALKALPTGQENVQALVGVTLGAVGSTFGRNNDVGGDKGETSTGIILHGGRGDDGRVNWDGMNTNVFFGNAGGQQRVYYFNTVGVQEVVVDTGGSSSETETGGANLNMVPKDGGNRFSVYGTANYTNSSLSASAISSDIAARGVTPQSSILKVWDYGVGVGGPIVKDKLWFYTPNRWWGSYNPGANNYFNVSTNPYQYVPNLSAPAYANSFYTDNAIRLTWQASAKNKFTQEEHLEHGCTCWEAIGAGALSSPEATTDFQYGPQVLSQTTWSYTATNRLLIQAGATFLKQSVAFVNGVGATANYFTSIGTPTFPGPNIHALADLSTGYSWGALPGGTASYGTPDNSNNFNQRVSVSYVTGSHAFKAGLQTVEGNYYIFGMQNGVSMVDYTVRSSGEVAGGPILNGVPVALTEFAGPFQSYSHVRSQGLFAQDQWTLSRLTLNLGVRFDHFDAYDLATTIPAGPFTTSRSVPELDNVPNFKDITPRIGGSYDVFGNGKTAIKASFGRYLYGQGGGLAQSVSPAISIVPSVTRTWNDVSSTFNPTADGCNLNNPAANGTCGTISNALFGQPVVNTTILSNASQGWGNREYDYQTAVQLQQELRPGIGLAAGYFHTWWGNMTVLENTATAASDYSQYCITEPTDARLGSYSGTQECGFYNVNPNKFGQVNNVITLASSLGLGTPQESYNGIDIGINARWGKGAFLSGGVTFGRETVDYCYANGQAQLTPENFPANYPRNAANCRITSSWLDGIGTQAKLQIVYPLPYGFQVSGSFKDLPGVPDTANLVLTNAQVAPSLGRPLSACPAVGVCTATVTQALVPYGSNPGTTTTAGLYDLRLNETDLRMSKTFQLGSRRLLGILDIYNVFNERPPQAIATTYGASWERPTVLLGGRTFKFGGQFNF